jgi:F0F1-type ATP synthase membrane subunit b/b'
MNDLLIQEYLYVIGPTAILSLALAAVAVSYVFLLMRLGKSEKDKIFLQSKIRDQTSEILKDAHEKRLRIIQEATERAHSIIKDTEGFRFDTQKQFAADLQDFKKRQEDLVVLRSEEISKLFDGFIASLQQSAEKQFGAATKNMEKQAVGEMEDFRKEIESERLFVKKQMSERLDEEYKKAQKNIEDYRAEQIKKLDKQVFDIVNTLTREVVGRSLSMQDHQDLVQKALVQMKTDMDGGV